MYLIDTCNDFVQEAAPFVSEISFSRRSRFTILDHSVDIEEFVLKLYYDKEQFEHLIDRYVNEMLSAIKNSKKLYDAGWDIHNFIVDRFNVACDYFGDVIYLIVKTF